MYPRQIELRRLNRYGYQPWGSSRVIRGIWPETRYAQLVSDGHNGVIIAYLDRLQYPPPYFGLYHQRVRVQRVDSAGNLLWGLTGVRVSIAEHTQSADQSPAIVSDGTGGCIVAWKDTMEMIGVQRIDSVGARAWGDSGIILVVSTQYSPTLVRTETDKFVVAFGASLKKVDFQGNILWGGQTINVGFGTRAIMADSRESVIVYDGTGSSPNIRYVAQRIDSSGTFLWQQPYVVIAESTIFFVNGYPMAFMAPQKIIYCWRKNINGNVEILVQMTTLEGTAIWPAGGRNVSRVPSPKGIVGVLPSDSMSAVFIWGDSRTPSGIYGQRLDTLGRQLWDTNDAALNFPLFSEMEVTTDGSGGAIGVGFHQFDFSIRALKVSKYGNLGEVITSIRDKGNHVLTDQFSLFQNYPNPFNSTTIIRYDVPSNHWVTITLYNTLGQNIKTIVDAFHSSGTYSTILTVDDLPTGIYFYRMQAPHGFQTRKLIILK